MNLGHSCETSREIFAYPYPGRSAKITSGRGLPGQRISKKLMLRVRPGVELVRASLVPTRELITLDLPTFDRPRNAISGRLGAGNCATSVAAVKNRERTLILKFPTAEEPVARERIAPSKIHPLAGKGGGNTAPLTISHRRYSAGLSPRRLVCRIESGFREARRGAIPVSEHSGSASSAA